MLAFFDCVSYKIKVQACSLQIATKEAEHLAWNMIDNSIFKSSGPLNICLE